MVPPSARFPTRRAALAEEAARRALAGLGPELVLPQLRAQTVQELLAQPGQYLMLSGYSFDYSTRVYLNGKQVLEIGKVADTAAASEARINYMDIPIYTGEDGLAVRHVPVGDHLPCSSTPGAGAGRRPGSLAPCFGLRRAGGAGSKAAFPRCAALPAGRCPRRGAAAVAGAGPAKRRGCGV